MLSSLMLNDGYILGRVTSADRCPVCRKVVDNVVAITETNFPPEFGWEATVLNQRVRDQDNFPLEQLVKTIGLECGCYAKLHRQITHIREKMGLT